MLVSPPEITAHPENAILSSGGNVTLSVEASGDDLSYQWTRNGNNIVGANDDSYIINNAQASNAGSYVCVVTNPHGSVSSHEAKVAVMAPPVIVTHPASQSVMPAANVTFFIEAESASSLNYQWKKDGTNSAMSPGGSSGGSSSAVAARIAPAATGTDTGGSIRQPAAFTGICGIKPTYGRCSRWGVVAFASSLDQAGPMARSVEDCAIMLEAMAGFDPKDATSLQMDVPNWEAALSADLKGKKIGIPREYRMDGTDQAILDSWEQGKAMLRDAGAEIVDVSLPHTKYALPAYYIIAPAEASSNLARYDGVRYGLRDLPEGANLQGMYAATRAAGFGDEVKRRVLIGTYVLSAGFYDAYYTQAQKIRTLVAQDFEKAFGECDVILAPTTPTASFPLGSLDEDPLTMYLNDVFAVPASLAGLPAMSVPATMNPDGLPLGLQIVGRPFDEQGVLNAGLAIQQRANFDGKPEKWW